MLYLTLYEPILQNGHTPKPIVGKSQQNVWVWLNICGDQVLNGSNVDIIFVCPIFTQSLWETWWKKPRKIFRSKLGF